MKDSYKLNDFIVADQINKLVNYSIDSKLDRAKNDKHIRGVVGTINNDVCDFYIYNSATPIVDVKINPRLTVFEGDSVYALAINGNLSNLIIDTNTQNYERLFGYTLTNFKLIEGFQDSTE
jgi:hypothetical protein